MNLDKNNIMGNGILNWIELYVAVNGSLSRGDILGLFSDISEDDAGDFVFSLQNNCGLYGHIPPYKINENLIESKLEGDSFLRDLYIFLLILSTYGNKYEIQGSAKIFERISKEAFNNYLGGESLVFGFPNEGESVSLDNKISELASWIGYQRYGTTPLTFEKDGKLDIVSKKDVDNRPSKIVFLGQCAAGHNRKEKLTELSIDRWKDFIRFPISPMRCFSCTCIIDDTEQFISYSLIGGLLFDRARLYNFISKANQYCDTTLADDIKTWNTGALSYYCEGNS